MNQIYEQYSQDPDETFKMYVDRLMRAQPRFGGTFATPQQGQDATSKATGGLLTGLFPEYADKMGGGSSRDTGEQSPAPGVPAAPGARGDFASAEDVLGAQQFAQELSGMGKGLGQLGGALFGPAGMLLGLAPRAAEYYHDNRWDSFNRGQDSNAAVRAEAMSLGGLGTYSDQKGNLGTISNQALIDAYDREIFGTTGAELSGGGGDSGGGGYDYSGSGGWGTSDHSDYGDGGYDGSW